MRPQGRAHYTRTSATAGARRLLGPVSQTVPSCAARQASLTDPSLCLPPFFYTKDIFPDTQEGAEPNGVLDDGSTSDYKWTVGKVGSLV